ncbi:MAG: hypothetical protein U5L04_07965 [Trueperaceae bacterium]|nr:hypothetical protein [Trueperaceae bacterium]
MADPFRHNVLLHDLPDDTLPARHSKGAKRRTAQLQRFLKTLHEEMGGWLEPSGTVTFVVLNRHDWRQVVRHPYGLPFIRNERRDAKADRSADEGPRVHIVAAADYPERLLHRWDELFVRAAHAGEQPPGDLREFLDLLIGHEWGHAAANLSGLRSRVKWLDEFMATYIFLATLRSCGLDEIFERFIAWARLEVAGSQVRHADLGSFEYPRGKLKFDDMVWFQGVFTLRAADVLEEHGWDFPVAMKRRLTTTARGDVARTLVDIEPSFRDWFRVFSPQTPSNEVL